MAYKKAIVAFLDILGTKGNPDFESKYKIHRSFHESMLEFQSRDKEEANYYRKVFSFSDCVYIFHGLREGAEDVDDAEERLIQVALFNTTLTTIRLLNDGYLVRGGISYGDTYHDELSFFGPAVEEAYFLESKKAVTPRILISDLLGERAKVFADKAHHENFSETSRYFNILPKRSYIPELIQWKNNAYHLNPLYILEMEYRLQMGEREFTHQELVQAILKNVETQIDQHPWEDPVRAKLEWMREYATNSRCSLEHSDSSITITK